MRSIQEGSDLLPGLLPAGLGQVHCTWYSIEIARWKILTALLRFRNDGVEDDLFRQNMFKVKSLLVRWVESIAVPLFVNRGRTMLSSAEMLLKGHCSGGVGIRFCWHLLAPINTSCRYRLWYHCRVWRRFLVLQLNRFSLLQMLCGTEPHPKDFKAKKYKLEKHSLTKEDFVHIMKNLPVLFITIDNLNR